MARDVKSRANVNPPDPQNPYGAVRDESGVNAGDGTPVDEALVGDITIFFQRLMAENGVTPNNLADNTTNGFQLYTAMVNLITSLLPTGLSPNSVTTVELAPAAVLTNNIDDLQVTTAKIALLAITEALIANGAVTTDKIANASITINKLAAAVSDLLPTTDQKAALQGTDGSPSGSNRYVTDSDPRLVGASNGPWITIPMINGWATLEGNFQYRINAIGNLEFRGLLTGVAATASQIAASGTIPAAYRPSSGASSLSFAAGGSLQLARLAISTLGGVFIEDMPLAGNVSGIQFPEP